NYPSPVRSALDWLHQLREPATAGKLLLWAGEPGTGKTTAARSLFGSWAPWCAVEYIVDPERFISDPGYMAEVIGRPTDRSGRPSLERTVQTEQAWRVIVAEDVDQLGQASGNHSQGLSRLLNLADGVLGQGINSLVLLTTNEPLARLHPALLRPGRALAQLEFSRFSPTEAAAWLGTPDPPSGESTLAELFHRRNDNQGPGTTPPPTVATGQYL
ncbi:MAG: AAA family ATPase, partial [Microthrixaceae bacterium]